MLERFLEQSESIAAVCASPGYDAVYPSGLSLSEVRKIRDILRPFQETTKRMSGQKYITSSSVMIFLNIYTFLFINLISILGYLFCHDVNVEM